MRLSEKLLKAYMYIPALEDQSLRGLDVLGEWAQEARKLENSLKMENLAKSAAWEALDFAEAQNAELLKIVLARGEKLGYADEDLRE